MVFKEYIDQFGWVIRRFGWIVRRINIDRLINLFYLSISYTAGSSKISAFPAVLKIDISPICNLKCPVCVHADSDSHPTLKGQEFKGKKMTLNDYRKIVNEVKGKVSAFSLYYLGDPYIHPDVDEMCRIAYENEINIHISTNFSFKFSDDRIISVVNSGVTHLTVCVDGISQETYGKTRRGGRISWVLSNLERLCKYRKLYRKNLVIEVQFIKFNHNVHELPEAIRYFEELGIDRIETYWGMVNNYSELEPGTYRVTGPKKKNILPRCYWPFATMLIKYNGDVIPCCNYRHASQYDSLSDPKSVGNIFEAGIKNIWNDTGLVQARKLCANPRLINFEGDLRNSFCYGCPVLFESNYNENVKNAPLHDVS